MCIYADHAYVASTMVLRSSWGCGFKHGWWRTLVASSGELASFAIHCIIRINWSKFYHDMLHLMRWTISIMCMQVLSVSLFWTGAVLCNTVHVIVSGMVFLVLIHGGRESASMPRNPLMKCLRYAVTTSFGSICYGSLFTAAIRTLRWEVNTWYML